MSPSHGSIAPDALNGPPSVGPAGSTAVGWALTAIMCICAAFVVLTTIIVIRISYTPLPLFDIWDYWRTTALWKGDGAIQVLLQQHNEHRIAAARLLYLADHHWFSGQGWFLLVCSAACQICTAVILWRLSCRSCEFPRHASAFVLSSFIVFAFASQQFMNLTAGFQVQFTLVYASVAAAMYCLASSLQSQGWRSSTWFFAAALSGLVASFSMANGILVWPALIVLAAVSGARRQAAFIGAIGTAVVVLYFADYTTPPNSGSASPADSMMQPVRVLAFLLTYLGSPADRLLQEINGIYELNARSVRLLCDTGLGLAGMCAAVWLSVLGLRGGGAEREAHSRFRSALLVFMWFLIITGAATAIGRLNYPLEEATTSRYATPVLWFWGTVIGLVMVQSEGHCRCIERCSWTSRVVVLLGVSALVCLQQPAWILYAEGYRAAVRESEMAMVNDVYDEVPWKRVYYNPQGLFAILKQHRSERLHVFKQAWPHWIGENAWKHYRVVSRGERGNVRAYVDNAVPIDDAERPGTRLEGWAWLGKQHRSVDLMVVVDSTGRIVGFGRGGFPRPDVKRKLGVRSQLTGWKAYIRGTIPPLATLYSVAPDGVSLTPVTGFGQSTATLEDFDLGAGNTMLRHGKVEIDGDWALNGYYPGVAKPPTEAILYASYSGSDAHTGVIRLGPYAVAKGQQLGIPIITGPVSQNASIRVTDRSTGVILAQLRPPPIQQTWRMWRVPLRPSEALEVEIVAEDAGSGWGEWIGVGAPSLLKEAGKSTKPVRRVSVGHL